MSERKGGVYDTSAGDTNFRRKWDRDEYAQRAKEREKNAALADKNDQRRRKGLPPISNDDDPAPEKELLKARDEPIDLTSNLNKTVVVQTSNIAAKQPGYYCKVCDCTVKDSVNYLDHINGRKHQQMLGMSMKVERSTVDQVRARLEALKRKTTEPELDFDARIEKAKRAEEEEKRVRKNQRKEKKKRKKEGSADDLPADDVDVAAMMGFGGFGSSKK